MGRLTIFERGRVIKLFKDLEVGCKYKFRVITFLARNKYGMPWAASIFGGTMCSGDYKNWFS